MAKKPLKYRIEMVINEFGDLIDDNRFEEFYNKLRNFCEDYDMPDVQGKITDLLYESGIRPLNYCKKVPCGFFNEFTEIKNIVLPSNIEEIDDYAFFKSNLEKITFNSPLSRIQAAAFSGCTKLDNIDLSKGCENIQYQAFYRCESLTNIILPEDIKFIGAWAFGWCRSLAKIIIPKSIKEIGTSAFFDNTKIIYDGSKEEWRKVKKPEDIDELYIIFRGE